MSILIKGMTMPKSCWECRFNASTIDHREACLLTKKTYNWGLTTPPSDCPLIEIPQRHGRLIDADAFTKDECNNCDGACEALPCDCLSCKSDCRCDFMKDIADAPTVIEAET